VTDFSSLPLAPDQLSNLTSLGYVDMTAIQAASLPSALAGNDLIAQAKTGSGKTAAFALPFLAGLNPRDFGAQALILCPTRELATQVAGEIRRLARHRQNIKVVVLCGGQSIGPQIGSLEHGAHIVVGTPGRILDHLRKETLQLDRVSTLVLDEADRMLEMGFYDDMEAIIKSTPGERQTLLFSATYPDDIMALSARFQKSPERISVESLVDDQQISQQFYSCTRNQKATGLLALLAEYRPEAVVVFCNTKDAVREVAANLSKTGISALALHGDLEQRDRDQVLIRFRQRSCRILVATDVAARGLDIDNLPMVINFDFPSDAENYVHRIGRTGRADREGVALSLVTDREGYKLDNVGTYQNRELIAQPIEVMIPAGKALQSQEILPPPEFATLCISGGRRDKIRPGDILGALTGEAGIEGKAVGKIDVMDYAAYVAVERSLARKAIERLINGKIKGRRFKIRRL
jgi:ATP-independent RNA helicase DbpA